MIYKLIINFTDLIIRILHYEKEGFYNIFDILYTHFYWVLFRVSFSEIVC